MEALGIDTKLLFAQLINFSIFFILFKKFMAKPLMEFIKKQHEVEKEKERLAQKDLADEAKRQEKEKELLDRAKAEAAAIIAEAKKSAKKVEEQILKKAQEAVVVMKDKAIVNLDQEKKELLAQEKEAIVKTSSTLVKSVLVDVLDRKSQDQIMNAFLKKAKTVN